MSRIVNNPLSIVHRKGAALLVVLFIVMAITVLSLGFLSRSDVELACGRNMVLRTQIDYLAESGLEHARGLILNPQDIDTTCWDQSNPWTAGGQQLVVDSHDYYDVEIRRDNSDASDRCHYIIHCNSYRLDTDGEKTLRSNLAAELRLDPVIALWTEDDTTIFSGMTINGDMRCGGTVSNQGLIGGDVFMPEPDGGFEGINPSGQKYDSEDLSLSWPSLTVDGFLSRYGYGSLSGQTFGPYDPPRICYSSGSLTLTGNTRIEGMLVVDGNLMIQGSQNMVVAAKNLPALLVTGDLIVETGGNLDVEGLAVVVGRTRVSAGDGSVRILGGLFAQNALVETTADSSGNGNAGTLCGSPLWQPGAGRIGGALRFDNTDGTNDYVRVENESLFDLTGQITVAAWIRVTAFNQSFQPIATKGDSAWRIQRWSNTDNIEFACTGLSHNPPHGSLAGSISVNDGLWHHVAGVYDGSQVYLYIDGNLDTSMPSSGSISTKDDKVLIGANAEQSDRYWNGWIDDVRIYNRGLDADDIGLIRTGITAVPGLIGHWRLDESGSHVDITAAPEKTAILVGPAGDEEKWGQAAGAFFRSIERRSEGESAE